MTPAEPYPSGDRSHAWMRLVAGWHAGFWLVVVLAAAWSAVSPGLSAGRKGVVLGLLAVLAGTYLVTVQRGMFGPGSRSRAYLVVAIAVTGIGVAIHPAMTLLLFIVYTQTWIFSYGRRDGAFWSVLLTAATILAYFALIQGHYDALGIVNKVNEVALIVLLLVEGRRDRTAPAGADADRYGR